MDDLELTITCLGAEAALDRGELEKACDAATRCIDAAPDYLAPYHIRGKANLSLKRWSAARADFERIVALDPNHTPSLARAAEAAIAEAGLVLPGMMNDRQRELYLGARAHLKRALELAPGVAAGWAQLSRVEDKLGDKAAAIAANQRARDLA